MHFLGAFAQGGHTDRQGERVELPHVEVCAPKLLDLGAGLGCLGPPVEPRIIRFGAGLKCLGPPVEPWVLRSSLELLDLGLV